MALTDTQPSRKFERQKEDMIAHIPTVVQGETDEQPFVFSPRISEDGSTVTPRRRRALLRNLRSVFCCLAPQAVTRAVAENGVTSHNGASLASPAIYPSDGATDFIIGEPLDRDSQKKTLVLDLDETLVHSSFNRVMNPDYVIPVDIEGRTVSVYVQKRPGLDDFLNEVCAKFEVVIFTASLGKYANPLLDLLDPERQVRWRLFREACSVYRGTYVKDLTRLGRELSHTIIIDNSPLSYIFQPGNALPISAFMGDPTDQALPTMMPLLMQLEQEADIRDGISRLKSERPELLVASEEEVAIPIADLESRVSAAS